MQKFLFVDNFRGFRSTVIPIVGVNFFVGENSTGKTSLLGLLRLFTSPTLLLGPEFMPGDNVRLGHFNELVSAHAPDRSYFRIGIVEEIRIDKNLTEARGLLLTYVDSGGSPQLSQITSGMNGLEISLRYDRGKVLYRDSPLVSCTPLEMSEFLPVWPPLL